MFDKNFATGFFLGRDGTTADRWGGGVIEAGAPFGIFGTFTDGRVNVLESVRSGTTHRLLRAGVELASNTVSSSATSSDVYGIGANYTGSQNANVTVYEVLVFNRALADGERDRVTQYLCAKWGVGVG